MHPEDRLERWLANLLTDTQTKDLVKLGVDASFVPDVRSFKLYIAFAPILTSASTYKPTHVIYTSDEEPDGSNSPTLKTYKSRRHWTAWAGEWTARGRPSSEPDLQRTAHGSRETWMEQETRTWD